MNFVSDNLWLIMLAAASGMLLLWPWLRGLMFGVGEVGPTEAVALINREQALVLDVRDAAEYAAGHVADARHIPLAELGQRAAELAQWKDRPVLVNCQSGQRSASAAALLRGQGHARVFNLRGGLNAWVAAKLPIVKD